MKQYQEENRFDKEYIKNALDYCIENDILKEFFLVSREEVMKVIELDFTFEKCLEMTENEAYDDGNGIRKEIGKNESMHESILDFLKEKFSIPDEMKEKIIAIDDYEKIKTLNTMAPKVKTVEEFKKAL